MTKTILHTAISIWGMTISTVTVTVTALSTNPQLSKRIFVGTPAKLPSNNVCDFMSPNPVTLTTETSVNDAIEILLQNNISGAPVIQPLPSSSSSSSEVGMEYEVVGVVSSSDFLYREDGGVFLADKTESSMDPVKHHANIAKKILGQRVGDVMSPNPITIRNSDPMRKASSLMSTKKLHRLLVVDHDGALVGILSKSDVLRDLMSYPHQISPQQEEEDTGSTTTSELLSEEELERMSHFSSIEELTAMNDYSTFAGQHLTEQASSSLKEQQQMEDLLKSEQTKWNSKKEKKTNME